MRNNRRGIWGWCKGGLRLFAIFFSVVRGRLTGDRYNSWYFKGAGDETRRKGLWKINPKETLL